jgi:signal transduction histidine kinase
MRFRAFRGLSDGYRRAVEGHSPWRRGDHNPEPLLVRDVSSEPSLAAFGDLFEREGIGALAFVPLVAGGTLIGKFMVYYPAPRDLSDAELDMARGIANHVAAAVARFSALEELQRTVRFNEIFTGILGHDLRNPLGAILTAAELAAGGARNESMAKPLSRIRSSGARMARMIDQLLDLTRVRVGGGVPLSPARTDIAQVVRQVSEELETAKPGAKVELELRGSRSDGVWDADRLSQVFSNLIANALQHGEPGHGVRVQIDTANPLVVRVEVLNRGVIAAPLLEKIFEPMTGGDRRQDGSQGLGLGLYISREIVRAHRGRIEVSSDQDNGTRFSVVLPRDSSPPRVPSA